MPKLYFKQAISATISLSIVTNMMMPVCANGLLQANTNKFQPNALTAPATSNTGKITSMKAVESKINNFLSPKKKPFELSALKKTSDNNAEILPKDDAGSCGDGVYYKFVADAGILNIYGSGAMDDYSTGATTPWAAYKDSIKTVIINNGVTSIREYAFADFTALTSATIGDSVTFIGEAAFINCINLTLVNIGNGVTIIENAAFTNCSSLVEIKIPDNVTYIGEYAFWQCAKLTSILIGNNVTYIGEYAFWQCAKLTSILLPDNVISLGEGVFSCCTRLTSVHIGKGLTFLGAQTFFGCTELTSIAVDANNKNFQSMDGVLYSKDGKTLILCPTRKATNYSNILNRVTSIGDYAFTSCIALTQVRIPDNIVSIGKGIFYGCTELNSITVDSNNKNFQSIDGVLYSKDGNTLIVCPSKKIANYDDILKKVTFIGDFAFSGVVELTKINIPNNIISIGEAAFESCTNLQQINIPNSVISIKASTFNCCSSLTDLTLGNSIISIEKTAFYNCTSLTQLTIPNSVNYISKSAFECSGLKNITIPDSVTTIDDYAFYSCPNLSSVHFSNTLNEVGFEAFAECPKLTSATLNNAYATKNFKNIFPSYENFEQIVLGDNVHSIDDSAFAGCISLKNVTVSGNLDHIGKLAFSNCINLDNFVYKGTKAPNYDTGSLVFENCPKLEKITVPDNYDGDDFCGKAITKKEPKPTAKEWFTENVAWLAPAFTILAATVGLILKYDDVKNFCLSHCPCCNKHEQECASEVANCEGSEDVVGDLWEKNI